MNKEDTNAPIWRPRDVGWSVKDAPLPPESKEFDDGEELREILGALRGRPDTGDTAPYNGHSIQLYSIPSTDGRSSYLLKCLNCDCDVKLLVNGMKLTVKGESEFYKSPCSKAK